MGVSEKDFISFSKAEPVSDEFTYRNRISRGYYGVYHFCQKYYKKDSEIPDTDSHSQLIDSLETSKSEAKRKVGKKLYYLKSLRNRSDYTLNANITEGELTMVLIEIDRLLKLLD